MAGLLRSALTVETLASVVPGTLLHCWNLLHTASGPEYTLDTAHTETGSDARVGGAATQENYSVQEMIVTV